jgi:hypothetical protein
MIVFLDEGEVFYISASAKVSDERFEESLKTVFEESLKTVLK